MRRLAGSVFGRSILATLMLLPAGAAAAGSLPSNKSEDRDTFPPSIAVVAPFGRIVAEAPPEISVAWADVGSGIDPATLEFLLDGAAVSASCKPGAAGAVCRLQGLGTGRHRLTARVRDRTGNQTSAFGDFELVLDLLPPALTVSSPRTRDLLTQSVVLVSGSAKDESAVTLTINGQSAGISAGSFSTFVNVPEGSHELRIEAVDEAGRRTERTVTVFVDSQAPELVVETPAPGHTVNRDSVVVTGRAGDENGITRVEVGGTPVAAADGGFQSEVALQEGINVVPVRAFDTAGNASEVLLEVVRFTLPVVEIQSPEDLIFLAASTIDVAGAVSDPGAAVAVNGIAAEVSGTGFIARDVPLIEGGNILTATASTANGRVGTDTINVIRDLTAPRVVIHHPRSGALLAGPSVDVSGMVNDIVAGTVNASEATVTVNGLPAAVANRSFFVQDVPLEPGENVLTVVATDASGNAGRTEVAVRRETAAAGRVEIVSGNRQTAVIGSALPAPLVVELRDAAGEPVAGRLVLFKVAGSDGTLDGGRRQAAVATGPDGRAEIGWTLGTRAGAGNQVAEAVVSRFRGAVFTATALPGAPAFVVVDAGDQQIGTAGQALPRPLVATVTDSGHNRLGGVPVRFRVLAGQGQFQNRLQEAVVETDSDGRAIIPFILDPDERPEADVVQAVLAGVEGSPVASFVSYGRTAGDPAETAIHGIVVDNSNLPVEGVTLRILDTAITAVTDVKGLFRIEPAPVGTVKLIVDGSTAARPGSWPDLEFVMTTVAGRDNDLGMPIYLLPLNLGNGLLVDETRGGTLTLPEVPGFALEILPGSVTFPNGSRSGLVSVTAVHSDKVPMVPNFGQQPRLIVTIQPAGARFDPPARLTLPNVEGLAPGRVTEMYSFDHDLGHFVSIGPATVSENGELIVANPGVGILKAGWHCGGDPAAAGTPADCPPCQICNGSACVQGCPLGGSAAPGADPLAAIFAACTCDDNNECTINDRCDGSGGCTGDPVEVTAITGGACVAEVGQTLAFTAASTAPAQVKWQSPGGTPATGQGGSHSVTYAAEGSKAVTAACGGSSQSKNVTVGKGCGSITPVLTPVEVPMPPPGANFGAIQPLTVQPKLETCVRGGAWCVQLGELIAKYGLGINGGGNIDISGANDSDVTAATCAAIIPDLTPPGPGAAEGPPRATYWSSAITEAHERVHVGDFNQRVIQKTFQDLIQFLQGQCNGCTKPPAGPMIQQAASLWRANYQAYLVNAEPLAHNVSNPMYAALIQQIRVRAQAEGWPQPCR